MKEPVHVLNVKNLNVLHVKMDSLLCKNIIVELVTTIVPPVLKLENAPLVNLDISNMLLLKSVENVLTL